MTCWTCGAHEVFHNTDGLPERLTEEQRPILVTFDPQGRELSYYSWTDGYAIGYRVVRDDGATEFVYLNPSDNADGSDEPNVFVYSGADGDPACDRPHVHFVQRFGDGGHAVRDAS